MSGGQALARDLQHPDALIDARHVAALAPHELDGDGARAGGDVEHVISRPCGDAIDEVVASASSPNESSRA